MLDGDSCPRFLFLLSRASPGSLTRRGIAVAVHGARRCRLATAKTDAIDKSLLSATHKAALRFAVQKYADGNGLWFIDQKDWAEQSGFGRATVQRAVYAASKVGLLWTGERIYTTNGHKGTSLYLLRPDKWSKKPKEAMSAVEKRLSGLTKKTVTVHQDDAPSVHHSDATERDVAIASPTSMNRQSDALSFVQSRVLFLSYLVAKTHEAGTTDLRTSFARPNALDTNTLDSCPQGMTLASPEENRRMIESAYRRPPRPDYSPRELSYAAQQGVRDSLGDYEEDDLG